MLCAGHGDASNPLKYEYDVQGWRQILRHAEARAPEVFGASQGLPQIGHQLSVFLDDRAGGGRPTSFGKPHVSRWTVSSATPAGWAAIGRCFVPCRCGCLWAISKAVMQPAMAWVLATITLLLVRTCRSSTVTSWGCAADGTTGSSATRTMSTMGPAGPASPPATASERGWGPADQPAGSASPLSRPRSPSQCQSAEPYDERARQRQSRPGSNWHADTYYGAAATILRHHPLGS